MEVGVFAIVCVKVKVTQPILEGFEGKRMGMYAIYPKSRQPDQKLKHLVDHYREALQTKQAYYY